MSGRCSTSTSKTESEFVEAVAEIIERDPFRMRCLEALKALDLPQGYIGAGFLRNAIWDYTHNKEVPTPLNDVDVVYFSYVKSASREYIKAQEKALERTLSRDFPEARWQVKNQAYMHTVHGHKPYRDCMEAISVWIERETCVAVRLNKDNNIEVLAPFGLASNFAFTLTVNPFYPRPEVFKQRIKRKNWLTIWPKLSALMPEGKM